MAADASTANAFTTPAGAQPAASHRHVALFWMGVGAGAGLLVAVVGNAAASSCRQPDNLCALSLVTLPAFGAFVGLLVGA